MAKRKAKAELVVSQQAQPQILEPAKPINGMIVRLVSPYTFVVLILLDFAYLLIEALTIELLPLQVIIYLFAGVTGGAIVFLSEYLTNSNSTLREKAMVGVIGGIITALPFPVLGVGAGLVGLIMQYLESKNRAP